MIATFDGKNMYFIRSEEDAHFYVPYAYMGDMKKWAESSTPGDMLIIQELTFIKLSELAKRTYFDLENSEEEETYD